MQRRVAAIYLVFFVLLGASAYSVIAVAEQPAVEMSGEAYTNGSQLSAGDQQYTVLVEMEESEGDGHGGGGGAAPVGELAYVNESARMTATWENDSVVTYQGEAYRVSLDAETSPAEARLVESFDVPAILQNDSDVYNQTTTIDGTEYVTYRENDTNVPLDEYLPEPTTHTFVAGESVEYDGETTTLESVSSSEATLAWTTAEEQSVELAEGENVTLADGNRYFAHFDTHGELSVAIAQTDEAYGDYQNDLARQDYYHERENGLWGVVILSGIAAFLIISMAYMPVKG